MPRSITSIYLFDQLNERLAERGENRSATLNRDLDRYYDILRRSLPTFSRQECFLMLDTINGSIFVDAAAIPLFWASVEDNITLNNADKMLGADGPALVAKLKALSPGATTALVDALERVWRMCPLGDPQDALVSVGLLRPDEV